MSELPDPSDIEKTSYRFLAYVLLPTWILAGFADYLCHRRSHIEQTSGTHESLTHLLMISSTGVGVLAALLFEVNETVLTIMTASALAHEAIVIWDVGYAATVRPPSATEQHIHSFLEVLPFTGLAFQGCLHPDELAALFRHGGKPRVWRFERKRHPLAPVFVAAVTLAATLLLVVPHIEEFVRCFRVDKTILPHERPIRSTLPDAST